MTRLGKMSPSESNQHSALDELLALKQWAFDHPDHICNGLCPDEDPPSDHSPGMASRDPECEWCQRIDLFQTLFDQYTDLALEAPGLWQAVKDSERRAVVAETENRRLIEQLETAREVVQACYDDLQKWTPPHWRNQGTSEILARNFLTSNPAKKPMN